MRVRVFVGVGLVFSLLVFGAFPAAAYNSFTPTTYVNWTEIPQMLPYQDSMYYHSTKAITADNNDVYLFFSTSSNSSLRFIKYTYAAGTWGSVQDCFVGTKYAYNVLDDIVYRNGTFHILYKDYYHSGYNLYNLYYTASADPAAFPTGTKLQSYSDYRVPHINVRADGKVAIFYANRHFAQNYYVYSNYSGSWMDYNLGSPQRTVSVYQIAQFSGDSAISVYTYEDGEDWTHYSTDSVSWNGSAWTAAFSTVYRTTNPIDYIYLPENYCGPCPNGYSPVYTKTCNGYVLQAGSIYDERTYQYLLCGNYLYFYPYPNPIVRNMKALTKFNAPDGKIMLLAVNAASRFSYSIVDHMVAQPVTQVSKTANSLVARTVQDHTTDLATTYLRISASGDMAGVLATATHANNGGSSSRYDATFSGLLPATSYYLQSEVRDGAHSYCSPVVELVTLPEIPANVAFSGVSSTSLTISFTTNQNGPDCLYSVERSMTGNPSGTDWVQVYCGSGLSFTDTGLSGKTVFYYRVRAKNSLDEWSAYTPVNSVQTLDRDNVAPVVSLLINNGERVLSAAVLPVKLIAADNRTSAAILTYSYSFNNGAWSAPVTGGTSNGILNLNLAHGLMSSGELALQLRVYDEDGNVGIASGTLYYQNAAELPNVPMDISITEAADNEALTSGYLHGVSVLFCRSSAVSIDMASENEPFYQFSTDYAPYSTPLAKAEKIDVHLGAEGLHTLKLRLLNAAGVGGAETVLKIIVDKTPPVFQARFAVWKTITTNSTEAVVLDVCDNISALFQYRIADGSWQSLPADGQVLVPLSAGLNDIRIEIKDEAGLTAQNFLRIWKIGS